LMFLKVSYTHQGRLYFTVKTKVIFWNIITT